MSTLDQSRREDIDKSIKGRLLLCSHRVSCQLYGDRKHLFDGGCDRFLDTSSVLPLASYVEPLTESSAVDAHRTARIDSLRSINEVGSFLLRSRPFKSNFTSVHICRVVRRRLHCSVARRLCSTILKGSSSCLWETMSRGLKQITRVFLDISGDGMELSRMCLDVGRAALSRGTSV